MQRLKSLFFLLTFVSLVPVVYSQSNEPVTLTFMNWGGIQEREALQNMIDAFEAENPNIVVEQQSVPNDYATKLNTLAAANELPDLFHMSEGPAHEWAEEGRIMDLTPYVSQYPEFGNRLPQTFYYYAPGKTFGTMNAAEITMLFYNKEMFEEAGVTAPPASADEAYTWDEFVETAQQLTIDNSGRNALDPEFDANNIKQYGVTFPLWWLGWYPLVKSNGGDITNAEGTEYTLDSPEAAEVFQNLQDLIYKYHVAPTPTQREGLPSNTILLQSKRVAMAIDGQWNLIEFAADQVPVGVGVLPTYDKPTTVVVGSITAINADTEHPTEALKFWLFHNDPVKSNDLYSSGLMMPLEKKYYTEQEAIDLWTANEAHPPEYRQAGVDYLMNNAVPSPIILKNWDAIDPRLGSGLDPIWSGQQTAQEVLEGVASTVGPLLEGKYPTE